MNNSLLEKTRAEFCAAVCLKCVCKVKFGYLSRFRTGACQVITILKSFPSKIPLTMKIATSISL